MGPEVFFLFTTAALTGGGRDERKRNMDNRGKRQAASIFGGMGFYIALLVCAIAAGVVGYYALVSNEAEVQEQQVQTVDQQEENDAVAVDVPEVEPAKPVISDEPVVVESLQPTDSGQEAAEESSAPVTEDVPAASDAPLEVVNPVMGDTVSVFSVDTLTYDETLGDWRTHDGLDIQATAGTAVAAAAAGTVLSVTEDGLLGTMVVIDHHNGYTTTYASLEPETKVLAGDKVSAGTVIGTVGNTSLSEAGLGAHLHFAVAKDGEPVDPAGFLE